MQDKNAILKRLGQFGIMSMAFRMIGVDYSAEFLKNVYDNGTTFRNPFREDHRGSVGLWVFDTENAANRSFGIEEPRIILRDFGITGKLKDYGPNSPLLFTDCFGLMAKCLNFFPELLATKYIFPSQTCPPGTILDIRMPKDGGPIPFVRKQSFAVIIRHIEDTLDREYDQDGFYRTDIVRVKFEKRLIREPTFLIDVVPREWNFKDKQYWNRLSLGSYFLDKQGVVPVQTLYRREFGGEVKWLYSYNPTDPAYAYILDILEIEGKHELCFEIYFPKRNSDKVKSFKFYTNYPSPLPALSNFWFSIGRTYSADVLVIQKSRKDGLCLASMDARGFPIFFERLFLGAECKPNVCVIHAKNEGINLYGEEVHTIKVNYRLVIILFDNDKAGMSGAWKIRKKLAPHVKVTCAFVPKGTAKDFTDFRVAHGERAAKELVKIGERVALNMLASPKKGKLTWKQFM